MQNNISIGQYFPGDSFVHRLDPRTKILFSLLFIVCIFLSKGFLCFLMIAMFAFMCMKVSKISMKFIMKGLKPIMFIVLFTFMLNLFLSSGDDVFVKFGVISITFSGIRNAVFMAIRLILLVTCTQLLTLTTSPIQLTDGIERLLSPFKRIGFPAHELAMMMSIALRFIPTLIEETEKITKAQKARGADFETGGVIKRVKSMIPLLVPLFVGAFRRADELAMAMEARCYRGGSGRTKMRPLQYTNNDYYSMAAGIGLMASVIILNALKFF